MKQKFKNYLKLGILLFGISAIVTGCLKDDDFAEAEVSQEQQENGISVRTIYRDEIFNNPKIATQLNNGALNLQPNTIDNTSSARVVYNSNYQFYVDTDKASYIENGNYNSYTFAVTRDEDNGLVENLLLSLQDDGSYLPVLMSYNISEIEKELLANNEEVDLEGKITCNVLQDLDIASSILGRFSVSGNGADCTDVTTEVENYCNDANGNTIRNNGDLGNGCVDNYTTQTVITVTIDFACLSGGGTNSPSIGNPSLGGPKGNSGSGGGGSGGGATGVPPRNPIPSNPTPNNPTPDNPNDPQAPSTTIGGGNLTTPLVDEEDTQVFETPCTTLKDLLKTDNLSANIKPVIQSLWHKRYAKKEWYQQFEKKFVDGNYKTYKQPGGIQEGISINKCEIDIGGFIIGVIHLHPYKTQPMFSWQDLRSMRNLYNEATPFLRKDVFSIIVGIEGSVYALKINDYEAFNAKINSDWDTAKGNNDDRKIYNLNKEIQRKYKLSTNLERTFLQEFENYGVSLYKATGNLLTPSSSNLSNFKKLELEDDSTSSNVIPVPCN